MVGRKLPQPKGKREKSGGHFCDRTSLGNQTARTNARTNDQNETKRFPGWTHPSSSDECHRICFCQFVICFKELEAGSKRLQHTTQIDLDPSQSGWTSQNSENRNGTYRIPIENPEHMETLAYSNLFTI